MLAGQSVVLAMALESLAAVSAGQGRPQLLVHVRRLPASVEAQDVGPPHLSPLEVVHLAIFDDGEPAATAGGLCTLRAAIQEANMLVGDDVILVPSGIYTITIAGNNEDNAATGDLDIKSDITIQGSGCA